MAESPYMTVREVKTFTGVRPNMLHLPDESALDELLTEWIAEAQGIVEQFCRNSWTDADVPKPVRSVVKRVVGNMILSAKRHRLDQIRRVDDVTSERTEPLTPSTTFLNKPLQDELSPYVRSTRTFKLRRAKRREEMSGAI